MSLTTTTGLKILMPTQLALQRIQQKLQVVIFVHCFPHIDPELYKPAFIQRMSAWNALQLPVKDRGGLLWIPSLPQLLCCQLRYISRTLQNLTCCLIQLGGKRRHPGTTFWAISSWRLPRSKTGNASGIAPRGIKKRTLCLIKMRIAKDLSLHF